MKNTKTQKQKREKLGAYDWQIIFFCIYLAPLVITWYFLSACHFYIYFASGAFISDIKCLGNEFHELFSYMASL